MILAFDTYYYNNKAKTVGLGLANWSDETPMVVYREILKDVEEYEPGAFYKRELPCILSLLKRVSLEEVKYIIVDSFVVLDDDGRLGLGGYLYEALDKKIPIIGVAKTSFFGNEKNVVELYRGESKKPLYISAKGVDLLKAKKLIQSMHGNFRIPTMLQILDAKTKDRVE